MLFLLQATRACAAQRAVPARLRRRPSGSAGLLWRWVSGGLLAVLLAGCDGAPPEPPLLRIGHAPHDHHAALFVAASAPDRVRTADGAYLLEREFARRYDLVEDDRLIARLQIDQSTGGLGLIRRLAEDQLDLSFGGVPAIVDQVDRGMPIRMLAPAQRDGAGLVLSAALPRMNWTEFLAFAASRERPLRIGYKASLSVQNLVFEQRLADAGLSFSKSPDDRSVRIQLVNLSGPQHLVPALKHGLVDGLVTMQPYLAMAEFAGVGRLVTLISGMGPGEPAHAGYPCCAIAARDDVVAKQGPVLDRLLELFRLATERLLQDPGVQAEVVARWLGTSADVERRSLATTEYLAEPDADWDQGVREWLEVLRAKGVLEGRLGAAGDDAGMLDRLGLAPAVAKDEARDL